MTRLPALPLIAALALSACAGSPSRVPLLPADAAPTTRVSVRSIEVSDASLPLYAESDEIAVADASGILTTSKDLLWADQPKRAVTQSLVGSLARITGAKVAAEPWPFEQYPDARVTVRFDSFLAGADGQFRISGQYYVAPVESGIRETARSFDMAAPYAPGDAVSLSRAQANLLRDLAYRIARDAL